MSECCDFFPKDLLDYHLEQKREFRPVKKSLTSTTSMPQFKLTSESSEVMTTILDEQKVLKINNFILQPKTKRRNKTNHSKTVALLQCCSPQLLCALFCDKNGNLAHDHRFLLQTKCKAADKTLEQCFLKEFKATIQKLALVNLN